MARRHRRADKPRRGQMAARIERQQLSESGQFEGYLSVFNIEAPERGAFNIRSDAFDKSLAAHAEAGTLPALLYFHDPWRPIGAYRSMEADSNGLFVRGELALGTQDGAEARELLGMGAFNGMSIGGIIEQEENGQVTQFDLWEGSLVVFGANPKATVSAVQSADLEDLADCERYLRAAGHSRLEAVALVSRIKALSSQGDPGAAHPSDSGARELQAVQEAADRLLASIQTN